ncbi:mCG1039154 [Mus musculus]|nr:mCG1039154 [Mus musculus]
MKLDDFHPLRVSDRQPGAGSEKMVDFRTSDGRLRGFRLTAFLFCAYFTV